VAGQPSEEYKARKSKTYLRHGLGLEKRSEVLASLTRLVTAVQLQL